jgi:hypothetical protein
MIPKFRVILNQAIDEGVSQGLFRAYKHNDNPSKESIIESISNELINSFDEYFDFKD